MSSTSLRVLAVCGSLGLRSITRLVLEEAAAQLARTDCRVEMLDLAKDPLPLFNPDSAFAAPGYPALQAQVAGADVLLLGTPDYHGSMSGAMKNFLDHFWREFAGKLFAPIVASHEKGLTVADQLRTVARQCYAWALPYAVSFADKTDVQDGKITSEALRGRLAMLVRDVTVYGTILAAQRERDLAGQDPGFMAKLRPSLQAPAH